MQHIDAMAGPHQLTGVGHPHIGFHPQPAVAAPEFRTDVSAAKRSMAVSSTGQAGA
ncbi:hypothetical protein ACAG24_015305 [Mycobacterium sp. pW049]|uniref:hypothetical protein n=1 Tax=[Mycobacterium] bulgaricum TaxID=3238985 RepID=UPI00351B6034